jgi:hypothetical protein
MTDQFVEIKSSNVNGIFKVLANKGITWLVEDEDGSSFQVQKRLVVRGPWEESDDPTPPASSLAAQLAAVTAKPAAPAPKPAAQHDPNLVTLKQLCFDLDIEPRVARRRLRNSPLGKVGIGQRWEWSAGSEALDQVRTILTAGSIKGE